MRVHDINKRVSFISIETIPMFSKYYHVGAHLFYNSNKKSEKLIDHDTQKWKDTVRKFVILR